jgi:hypothetical protein
MVPGRFGVEPLLQSDQIRMQPQLKHRIDASARLGFELLECVEIPGIDHYRLFADHVRAAPQRQPDMCIVQIVRRAHGQEVHPVLRRIPPQLVEVPIETLELGEEARPRRVRVKDARRIVRVKRSDEPVARILDGSKVAGCDETGYAGHRKIS